MDLALTFSAFLLGLAAIPHCAVMCGPACAALLRGCGARRASGAGFHAGRLVGYAAAGAVAASSVGLLSSLGQASAALRPLGTLLHAAAMMLGVYLLIRGRQPAWLENFGRSAERAAPQAAAGGWQRMQGPVRSGGAGLLWVAWPCGLLQSALMMAALANTAPGGAAVMTAFGLASSLGLGALPWAWARASALGPVLSARVASIGVRVAGLALVAASALALGHDLIRKVVAWCVG